MEWFYGIGILAHDHLDGPGKVHVFAMGQDPLQFLK